MSDIHPLLMDSFEQISAGEFLTQSKKSSFFKNTAWIELP
jgi:hypothetical protein